MLRRPRLSCPGRRAIVRAGTAPSSEAPADASGRVSVAVPPGEISISVSAEGYVAQRETRVVAVGAAVDVTLALELLVTPPPGDQDIPADPVEDVPAEGDGDGSVQRVIIRSRASPQVKGGCASAPAATPLVVLLPLLLRRRRPSVVATP